MPNFLVRLARRFLIDSNTREYIEHNRRRWPNWISAKESESVVLIDIFDWNHQIYFYSYVANFLAAKFGAGIEAFSFGRGWLNRLNVPNRRLEKIYESFGAKVALTLGSSGKFTREAKRMAESAKRGIRNKADVLNLEFEGVAVGAEIYDSYLRATRASTLDIQDPRFEKTIFDAAVIYLLTKEYFSRKKVVAVFASHYVYLEYGIPLSVAAKHGVPIFLMPDKGTFNLVELKKEHNFQPRVFRKYKEVFAALPEEEKVAGRAWARETLSARLRGEVDKGIADMISDQGRPGFQGYGPHRSGRLMKETGRPRILLMLNCFLDAPHHYGKMIFPDFWEWVQFTLKVASETPYDWYVKPHPGGMPENDRILEELKAQFPKINFLDRTASNSQILAEGISAMFTVFGTAAHEFAYMNIPVVNAGENPHISYGFNLHAETVEQYEDYVRRAGNLCLKIDQSEIEEFFYAHYSHAFRPNSVGARLIDEKLEFGKIGYRVNDSATLKEYIATESPEKIEKVNRFFDEFFRKYLPGDRSPR